VFFNNRGQGKIAKIKKINKRSKKGYKSEFIGEAHEVFTECTDDIQGVINFVRSCGVSNIYLVGHSTGCQKSIYYLSQRGKQKFVRGVILLCPISDYASALKMDREEKLVKAEKVARKLVAENKSHELLPLETWPEMHDAQRFLSLYTPDSKEEIFTYVQPEKRPETLQKVKIPMLAVFAEKDEFRDRPTKKLAKWFEKNIKSKQYKIAIVKNAGHSFTEYEDKVAKEIANWLGVV
jgi:pimeloyl-ACP methyl ester carboxylesterase